MDRWLLEAISAKATADCQGPGSARCCRSLSPAACPLPLLQFPHGPPRPRGGQHPPPWTAGQHHGPATHRLGQPEPTAPVHAGLPVGGQRRRWTPRRWHRRFQGFPGGRWCRGGAVRERDRPSWSAGGVRKKGVRQPVRRRAHTGEIIVSGWAHPVEASSQAWMCRDTRCRRCSHRPLHTRLYVCEGRRWAGLWGCSTRGVTTPQGSDQCPAGVGNPLPVDATMAVSLIPLHRCCASAKIWPTSRWGAVSCPCPAWGSGENRTPC